MARPSLREKLASSAVDTLHTLGFKGCSIQDITEAAGVPKGSFFNHFENKEDLAIDALRRYLEGTRSEMLFDESVAPLKRCCAKRRPRARSIPVTIPRKWRASWSMPGKVQRSGSRSPRTANR